MASPGDQRAQKLLYLVQHGEAEPKSADPRRPLTSSGKETAERVAAWVARAGVQVDQIRHSGKLRAEQTAEVLAGNLQPGRGTVLVPGMGPNDDVQPVADDLADCPHSVMLVGHLPFLSRLAALLLTGNADRPLLRFRNAGLVGLVREEDRWTVACVVPPELVT